MIAITHVYAPNERTQQSIDSFKRLGYEVAVLESDTFRGNHEVLKMLYECYKRAATGHELFVYFDAADSYLQRPFNDHFFDGRLIYSTEKNCYPHKELAEYYPTIATPWRYLNGGGYGGELRLIIELFNKYKLYDYNPDNNAQHEQATAMLDMMKSNDCYGMDFWCKEFQSMAFESKGDFKIVQGMHDDELVVKNMITNTIPALLHFNGLTDMGILEKIKP